MTTAASAWTDAAVAAALFAVDPRGVGGVGLRALAGPVRERWLALVRTLLPAVAPLRRIPLHVSDGRLLGGLDLPATLRAGRPVAERGLLAEADGGVVVLAMAERLSAATAARIAAVQDNGEVVVERDGLGLRLPVRLGVIAFDEGMADDERPPAALHDRLAFHLDLAGLRVQDTVGSWHDPAAIAQARALLPNVRAGDGMLAALCEAALALGIASIRAPLLALRVARAAAALDGRTEVTAEHVTLAGRLVLAPRATTLAPAAPAPEAATADEQRDDEDADGSPPDAHAPDAAAPPPAAAHEEPQRAPDVRGGAARSPEQATEEQPLPDVVLQAAQAAIPPGLLAQLVMSGGAPPRVRSLGRAGAAAHSGLRGRPAGVRRGEPRAGGRLNLIETLRAAAPWQRLRRRQRDGHALETPDAARGPLEIRPEDFRVSRFKQRTQTTTIFVVDASGSSALHRLAEAKGAVELLLADCYVRRDRVAVLAFRGQRAEVLLPPTRSLVRAKRSLASLPGGGGTPLAAGIDTALTLADAVRRRGGTPTVVLLTDGRANVARNGTGGRARANEDALAAARRMRGADVRALLIDTSPQPQAAAARLAGAMGARYLALPCADANALSAAVRAAGLAQRAGAARGDAATSMSQTRTSAQDEVVQ